MIRSELTAELRPFDGELGGLALSVQVLRLGTRLELDYRLTGVAVADVELPSIGARPTRLDRLWERTCFEAFLSEAGQPFYWELNFSPSLDWNLYHFRDYREGQRVDTRMDPPRISVLDAGATRFRMTAELDFSRLLPERTHLDLGLSAVIVKNAEKPAFWALAHRGGQPDFHLRDTFKLRI